MKLLTIISLSETRIRIGLIFFLIPVVFLVMPSCEPGHVIPQGPLVSENGVYDAPSVRSYPSSPDKIQAWIDKVDLNQIRAHGWDIWESITMDTAAGAKFPIWETWYTGHEVFDMDSLVTDKPLSFHPFEAPKQFHHFANDIPIDTAERPLSFNRFSRSLAEVIWDKRLNRKATFDALNAQFDADNTPIGDREASTSVDTIDAKSFSLKPVFQFISGSEPTALPYWAGNSPNYSSDQLNPEPHTWKQCVVVDPTGILQPGETHTMKCNDWMGEWPVISMDEIFHIKITEEEAESFSEFAETSGDDVGRNDSTTAADLKAMVKAGNIALLMAMHVTGKEIVNWTWQTFWWSPTPNLPPFGHDRPRTIAAPWSNYDMKTAYFMTYPDDDPMGIPHIAFNPYLETNLKSTFTNNGVDTVKWYGVFSNCMSCHRLASIPEPKPNKNALLPSPGQYTSNGFIDKSDEYLFAKKVKTDFLWSIATRVN